MLTNLLCKLSKSAKTTFSAGVLIGLSIPSIVSAQSPNGDIVGQATVGYQGWFSAGEVSPPDGLVWEHWSVNNQKPTPLPSNPAGNLGVKAWPDMRPYQTLLGDAAMQFPTGYGNFGNGLPATMFTSYNRDVTDIHMKWLGQYGIHTVAIQRFNPTGQTAATINAGNVLATAPKYGVKFYIEYDLSGWTNYSTELPADWTNVITGKLKMTASPNYARQNGKPVVQLWIASQRTNTTPQQMATLIQWLQGQGLYVILGTSRGWRTEDDSWLPVYNQANMIQPWMVGAIGNKSDTDNFVSTWRGDLTYATAHGFDFEAAVLPGDNYAVPAQRVHGDFMWEQFANVVSVGIKSVFISMYDEYNEGNQIMPTAEDASMTPGITPPLDIDGVHCSSDYYMRLTADGTKMLQGKIPLTYNRPTQPVIPVTHLVPGTIVTLQSLGDGLNVTADNSGTSPLIANRSAVAVWEAFRVVNAGGGNIALQSLANNLYVTAENAGASPLIANRLVVGPWETFTEVTVADGNTALLAHANNHYVTANSASTALIASATQAGAAQTFIVTAH